MTPLQLERDLVAAPVPDIYQFGDTAVLEGRRRTLIRSGSSPVVIIAPDRGPENFWEDVCTRSILGLLEAVNRLSRISNPG
jgi:hypothetical protein